MIPEPEMIMSRIRASRDLEATFDTYLDYAVSGYDAFLVPALEEGETLPDCRHHLLLLKRRVIQHREALEIVSGDLLGGFNGQGQFNLDLESAVTNFLGKMRDVRHSCYGLYGEDAVELTGLKGILPRIPDRLYSKGLTVKSSLRNSKLVLTPRIVSTSEGDETKSLQPADLAAHLEPEFSVLGTLVNARNVGRRGVQDLRSLRLVAIDNFDRDVRGVVRIATGIMRVTDRPDAVKRFRDTLRPLNRRRSSSTATDEAPAPAPDAVPASDVPHEPNA